MANDQINAFATINSNGVSGNFGHFPVKKHNRNLLVKLFDQLIVATCCVDNQTVNLFVCKYF